MFALCCKLRLNVNSKMEETERFELSADLWGPRDGLANRFHRPDSDTSPVKNGGGQKNRTPLARHQSTVFKTVRRPCSGTLHLGVSGGSRTHKISLLRRAHMPVLLLRQNLVPEERLELSRLSALVSKTSMYAFHHSGTRGGARQNRTVE